MNDRFITYKPSLCLQPFVESFWEGQFNTAASALHQQQVPPRGLVQLILHLTEMRCDLLKQNHWDTSPPAVLQGLYTEPYNVYFRGAVNTFSISFKPEGFYSLFGVPPAVFSSSFADAAAVLNKEVPELCSRLRDAAGPEARINLVECFLIQKLHRHNNPVTYLNRAAEIVRVSGGMVKVEDLAAQSYVSLRQLEREFVSKIGLTPKQYIRLVRLNGVFRRLQQKGALLFTQLAYEYGYADQAHFIRDFRSVTGQSPKLFHRNQEAYILSP